MTAENLSLSRRIPARVHTETFTWLKRDFSIYNADWRRIRAKMKEPFDDCDWCKRKFADGEHMALAGRPKGRNFILCHGCVDEMEGKKS